MQKYKPKSLVAEAADRFLRILTACLIGIGWFVYLWGLTFPALASGAALGVLLWLCLRQFTKKATQKREKEMRRLIGGEIALERLLMESPRKAAFLCALWLEPRYPLSIQKAVNWGVVGEINSVKTMIRVISQHPSQAVSAQQVLECIRETRNYHIEKTLLCLTAPAAKEAAAYAAGLDPPVQLILRDELIELAGFVSPATDEDLRSLGRQKRTRLSAKEWLAVILDASRARRYFWYGIFFSLFAMVTGSVYYLLPGIACLLMYAGCKLASVSFSGRKRWTG